MATLDTSLSQRELENNLRNNKSRSPFLGKIKKVFKAGVSSILTALAINSALPNNAYALEESKPAIASTTPSSSESPLNETLEKSNEVQSLFDSKEIVISQDSINNGFFLIKSSQDGSPYIVNFAFVQSVSGKDYLIATGCNADAPIPEEEYRAQLEILKRVAGHPEANVRLKTHDKFKEDILARLDQGVSGELPLDKNLRAIYHRTLALAEWGSTSDTESAIPTEGFAKSHLDQYVNATHDADTSMARIFKGIYAAQTAKVYTTSAIDKVDEKGNTIPGTQSIDLTGKLQEGFSEDDFAITRSIEEAAKALYSEIDKDGKGIVDRDQLRVLFMLASRINNQAFESLIKNLPDTVLEELGKEGADYNRNGSDAGAIYEHNQRTQLALAPTMEKLYGILSKEDISTFTDVEARMVLVNMPKYLFGQRYLQNIGSSGGTGVNIESMTALIDKVYMQFGTTFENTFANAYNLRTETQTYAALLATSETGDVKVKQLEFQLAQQLNTIGDGIEEIIKREKAAGTSPKDMLAALTPSIEEIAALDTSFDKLPNYSFKAGVLKDSLTRVWRLTVLPRVVPVSETVTNGTGDIATGHTDRTTTGSRETSYDKERVVRTNAYKLALNSYFPNLKRFKEIIGEYEISYGFGGQTKMMKVVPAPIPGAVKSEEWKMGKFETKEPIVFSFALEDANDIKKPAEVSATLASKQSPITVAFNPTFIASSSSPDRAPAVDANDLDVATSEKAVRIARQYKMRVMRNAGMAGVTANNVEDKTLEARLPDGTPILP